MQLRVDVDPGHLSPGTDIANLGLVRVADSVATTVSSVADAIGGRVETVGPVEFGSWTVAPVPGRPALRVRLNPAGGIDVEWPLAAVGFHLERADVLASGVTWEAVAEPVEVVDGWNRVRLPAGAAARFFRLR